MIPKRKKPPNGAMKSGYEPLANRKVCKFLRTKADFFEGFANALSKRQRAWLLNQVVDMRRLLNELEKSRSEYIGRFKVDHNLSTETEVK